VTITRPNGVLVLNTAGAWTFTASSAFDSLNVGDSINEVFNVTTVDGTPTTISVTINGTNDNPVAAADTQTTDEDTVLTATVPAGSDIDDTIDPNGFALVTNVAEGALIFNPNGTYSFDPTGDFDDLAPGGSRDVTFTYTSSDNNGGVSAPVTVTITVTGLNDIAVSTLPAPQTATEDTTLTISGISVQDADNAILTTTLTLPANTGIINVTAGGGATIIDNGTNNVVISGTSAQINAALLAVDYTPVADFNTTVSGPIAMGIEITDGIEAHTSSLVLTVLPVIDISDDAVTTNEEQQVTFDVLANDSFEGVATVSVFTQAQNGTVVLNPNGTFTYTPEVNFEGADSFTYTATVNGITETASVTITVLPVNDNPVAIDDSYSVDGATGATGIVLNLLDNDTDIDGDSLVVSNIAGQPVTIGQTQSLPVPNGEVTISASGLITFYPDPSFVGDFNFDYEISDGQGGTASATVYIDVTPAPRVDGEYRYYDTFRPEFTVPLRPVDPALHVLLSVQQARNEIQLSAGLNLLDVDSVAYKELLGGLDIGLAFASGDNGLGELGGKDFSPLGIDSYPDNALYVQQSVRQIPLPTSHAVFVQLAVNQSQLESAARNGLVDSFNSASLGVNHLLDPFAKPELSATKIVANNDRLQISDDVNNTLQKLTDKQAPSSLIADHTAFVEHVDVGGEEITAANSFSEQLRQSAALRLASGSENLIIHHKKA